MAVTINSNIESLRAQRGLSDASTEVSTVFQRLSSGLRINKASDDAAGLAIATGLQTDSRIYSQARRNINDGTSLLSIAEGALEQLSNITTRIMELAEQSSNGIYSNTQRKNLDAEAQALAKEYQRITATTQFNGQNLLSGSSSTFGIQVGASSSSSSQIVIQLPSAASTLVNDGSFQAERTIDTSGTGITTQQPVTGDINGDGKLDILWTDNGHPGAWMIFGNGDGTFTAPSNIPNYSGGNRESALVDMNGDGKLDVVATSGTGDTYIVLGNGDGTFKAEIHSITLPAGGDHVSSTFGDFNGDGKLDIANFDTSNKVLSIAVGNGNGTLKAPLTFQPGAGAGPNLWTLDSGDVNNDGKTDIFVGGSSPGNGSQLFLGNGDGTFRLSTVVPHGLALPFLRDLNNDGNLDLIGDDGGNLSVSLGNGDGTFNAFSESAGGGVGNLIDVNGDGILDDLGNIPGVTGYAPGIGDGTFGAPVFYLATIASSGANGYSPGILAADFTGDGALDILIGSDTGGEFGLYVGNGVASSGLPDFSLATQSGALSALDSVRAASESISRAIGAVGSFQSRLDVANQNLSVTIENYDRSSSQIVDADVAVESANLVRATIRQQVAASIATSANQQPALALQLLRGV